MKHKRALRSLATHSLVASIFSSPFLLITFADIYKIATNDSADMPVDDSLILVMTTASLTAFVVSFIAFYVSVNKRARLIMAIGLALLALSWFASQLFIPLGIACFILAAGVLVYGIKTVQS